MNGFTDVIRHKCLKRLEYLDFCQFLSAFQLLSYGVDDPIASLHLSDGLQHAFLDMDHTLCDTHKADEEGCLFKRAGWLADSISVPKNAELKIRYFMRLLYEGHESVQKAEDEGETPYRARLLALALGDALRPS